MTYAPEAGQEELVTHAVGFGRGTEKDVHKHSQNFRLYLKFLSPYLFWRGFTLTGQWSWARQQVSTW